MSNPVPIIFPLKGVNEEAPYAAGITPSIARADHVLNMRAHDSIERRARGGQRTGISRYFPDDLGGAIPIQAIGSAVQSLDPSVIIPDQRIFNFQAADYDTGRLTISAPSLFPADCDSANSTPQITFTSIAPTTVFVTNGTMGTARSARQSAAASSYQSNSAYLTPIDPGNEYVIRAAMRANYAYNTENLYVGAITFRLSPSNLPDGVAGTAVPRYYVVEIRQDGANLKLRARLFLTATSHVTSITTIATSDQFDAVRDGTSDYTDPLAVQVEVTGNVVAVSVDGNELIREDIGSTLASQTRIGITTFSQNSRIGGGFNSVEVFRGVAPASLRTTKLIAVSGGGVYIGTPDSISLANNGAGAVKTSGLVRMAQAFQQVYFCDGLETGYKVLGVASGTVSTWTPTAGNLPTGSTDPNAACRLITLYRGRIVLSGLHEEPHNWFMSRSGDPLDWDYSPAVTDALQAVAGNASNAGEIGDVVTSLMPFNDDLMFIGGESTMWVMRGDPAAGGAIDNISRQIGIVGPDAWTYDEQGTMFFFGSNGLYALQPRNPFPQMISGQRMDRIFGDIDTAVNRVTLLYDREWQGVHIFIQSLNLPETAPDHWFWDRRTDSFWRDQYPAAHGPTAVHLFNADRPTDRAVLLGGFDGVIRCFDPEVNDDDGETIESYVGFPLMHPQLPMGQFQMNEMQMTCGVGGSPVTLNVYRGTTPEEAASSSTSVLTAALVPGRNLPIRKRLRAGALWVQLRNASAGQTWAYEAGAILIDGVGRQRARL